MAQKSFLTFCLAFLFGILFLASESTARLLNRREDGFEIRKRTDLVTLYNAVPNAHKVQVGGVQAFPLDLTRSATYTTAEFYGCTIVFSIDSQRLIIGHFAQETGSCTTMEDDKAVKTFIIDKLQSVGDSADYRADTNAWIITSSGTGTTGYKQIVSYFEDENLLAGNIHPFQYSATSGVGGFANSAMGKAVVEVVPNTVGGGATINLYIQSDTPSWSGNYDVAGNLQ